MGEREQAEASLRAADSTVERLRKARADSSDFASCAREADEAVARAKASVSAAAAVATDAWVRQKLVAELHRVEGELRRAKLLGSSTRSDPLSAAAALGNTGGVGGGRIPSSASTTEDDARTRILQSGRVLNESSAHIASAMRSMVEARDTGEATLLEMHRQGEDLLGLHDTVRDTNSTSDRARRVLQRMARNALYNRVFLWSVILALFLGDVLFLYYGFLKH